MPKRKQTKKEFFFTRFNAIDIACFTYTALSSLYILLFFNKIETAVSLLLIRVIFCSILVLLAFLESRKKTRLLSFIRILIPMSSILYWYPETYALNHNVFAPNFDAFFNQLDFTIFGCFPALRFSALFPQAWISELMYFAYFSYYIFYSYLIISHFASRSTELYRLCFTLLGSFFIFYILFILIPVEGPIFYYPISERYVPEGYLFASLMHFLQEMAEKPTAAFPSSHVGMTVIFLIEIYRLNKKVLLIGLPVAIVLFMSTVYIKAHYLVDVIAGFIVAPPIYLLIRGLYSLIEKETNKFSKSISSCPSSENREK